MTYEVIESRTLAVGGKTLDYSLRRTARRRTIGIFVEPDKRVTVLVPANANIDGVEQILSRRISWIRRQKREIDALPPPMPPRQWVNGETHRYLGRQYRLKLVKGPERSVKLYGAFFWVTLPDPKNREVVRELMVDWYRIHAKAIIEERTRILIKSTSWLEISELPPITIRLLSHRWGSTTKTGRISFNVDVVKLPPGCLDYVIAHELVHIRIPNHSPSYWRMLGRVMPDWKKWRNHLSSTEI
jgi:predicted metal-dependent hydrolase